MLNHYFSVDLGLQAYTGERKGIGGSLQVRYEFLIHNLLSKKIKRHNTISTWL